MFRYNILPVSLIALIIILFYSWRISFADSPWLISAGANGLHILVGMVSLVWLYQAYRNAGRRQKNFWLLLFVGVTFYTGSNWLWLFLQISQRTVESEPLSSVLWLIAYLFFLAALISKTRELSGAFSSNAYGFNITVFMVTAASIGYHYLIQPVLDFAEGSLPLTLATLAIPIVNLTILFVITILYYLIQKNEKQSLLLLCITGFSLQVTADFIYGYVVFNETYQAGHFVDLLWLLSTLFIGFTAYYAKDNQTDNLWLVKNPVRDKAQIFPYVSIVVLIALVIHSYQWDFNALSAGLLLALILLLGHQVQILRKNQQLVEQYRHLAYHDPLTGLRNRGSFKEEMARMLGDDAPPRIALLLLDLDKFKVVNDTLGHHIGDAVLIKTAKNLEAVSGRNVTAFRLGGDEFIVVLREATHEKCTALAENIVAAFQDALLIEDYQVSVTPSIGISLFPNDGNTTEKLMQNADAAMYWTKENGKNGFSFYNLNGSQEKIQETMIETKLKPATR
ncbi:diguanylate cyclase domain-containing protein [Planococcus sp. X10-3]|uniref:diguanylate cyclase domain-containing protein n=1 Tax=Planococcus sp. X10-3 TaxID=3061240 RepID=UPI003BAE42CD